MATTNQSARTVKWSGMTVIVGMVVGTLCGNECLHGGTPAATSQTVATSSAPAVGPDRRLLENCRRRGIEYLRTAQSDDGSWTSPSAPGIAALAVTALLKSGVPASDPVVHRGLEYLSGLIQKDGGIYYAQSLHRNYETCIALVAFDAANVDGRHDKTIAGAEAFLRKLQWDEDEVLVAADPAFGGAGYGKHQRPDLSNTQFLLEALRAAGVAADDPAMQNALVFVSRCQNLESEHNTTAFAAKVNDGGFYYTPAAGGTSQAGQTPDGGLRSYGSMTYAGLKSMIYAGLTRDDPRVEAAFQWIRRFYTLEENPGLDRQGLFYYYHTVAKTLSVLDVDVLDDAKEHQHDWRKELTQTLSKHQKPNGSWINEAERWYEGDPNLVTAYSLLALSYCDPKPAPEDS